MKNLWMVLATFLLCLGLVGCGGGDDTAENNTNTNEETDTNTEETADEQVDETMNGNDEANLERADEAEKKVTDLEEVESATVIITDNNAYVAAVLQEATDGTEWTDDSEGLDQINAKISDEVRGTVSDLENVYVSVNPDFVERMNDYADKINAGEPVEGLLEEFNETAKRIFPDAK